MKLNIIAIILLLSFFNSASAQSLVVKKKDGTSQVLNGNLYFPQDKTNDSWAISSSDEGVYRSSSDISNIRSISVLDGIDLDLVKYQSPSYIDYYITAGSSWADRAKWNLANVHDPTVMKADDGYYYMYCTDAGYGNPHNEDVQGNKHGHFQCRRSKDLVNWE